LDVARAGGVGVGQLVDEEDRRPAGAGAVQVELLELDAAVLGEAGGQELPALEQRLGLPAAVGLDPADDHVDAAPAELARAQEHGVRLAHPGGGAEEDLQLAAALALLL